MTTQLDKDLDTEEVILYIIYRKSFHWLHVWNYSLTLVFSLIQSSKREEQAEINHLKFMLVVIFFYFCYLYGVLLYGLMKITDRLFILLFVMISIRRSWNFHGWKNRLRRKRYTSNSGSSCYRETLPRGCISVFHNIHHIKIARLD